MSAMEPNQNEINAGMHAVLKVAEEHGYGFALRTRLEVVQQIAREVLVAARPYAEEAEAPPEGDTP